MLRVIGLFILIGIHQVCDAQVIEGRIVDKETGEGIIGAHIQVENYGIITTSNLNGAFRLSVTSLPVTLLVSHLSFKTKTQSIQRLAPIKISMTPQISQLEDVSIEVSEDKRWRKQLKKFERLFFGTSKEGNACDLVNPWVIDFDREGGFFKAQSNDIIQFKNNYSGYLVSLMLETFYQNGNKIVYRGKPFFEKLKDDKYLKNREKAFYGSVRHFFHAATRGISSSEGFIVTAVQYDPSTKLFNDQYQINDQKFILKNEDNYRFNYSGYLKVVYINESNPIIGRSSRNTRSDFQQSYIYMDGSSTIYPNGSLEDPEKLVTFGYWSEYERAGHWLPFDYFPEDYLEKIEAKEQKKVRSSQNYNGFKLNQLQIPESEIKHGGPHRDEIPAILLPYIIDADESVGIREDDLILGIKIDGEARAYPLKILNRHEAVNDQIHGVSVLITYCPLCGSGMAFDRMVYGEVLEFGISGLLYNSDVLLYDRTHESLWSQIDQKAISGPRVGSKLSALPLQQMTWSNWKSLNPETKILSMETGYLWDYEKDPYEQYRSSDKLMFPVTHMSDELSDKESVLGVTIDNQSIAFSLSELSKLKGHQLDYPFMGKTLKIAWNEKSQSIWLENENIPATQLFWFAWYAFHPETEVFRAN